MTKAQVLFISLMGILLALVLTAFIFLMGIRGEFIKYLSEKYSDLSFRVGFTKIDPIYGKFYTDVTCLNDNTPFPITKSFKTKEIQEDYPQYKSRIQYNSKIKGMFDGSDIKSHIESVTGGSKIPFEDDGVYTQINIHLTNEAQPIPVAKKVLYILKENNTSAERVILTYESDKHVYEMLLSSDDYTLNENELEAKVKRIK